MFKQIYSNHKKDFLVFCLKKCILVTIKYMQLMTMELLKVETKKLITICAHLSVKSWWSKNQNYNMIHYYCG